MLRAIGRAFAYPIHDGWRDPKLIRGVKLGLAPAVATAVLFGYWGGELFTVRPDPFWVGRLIVLLSLFALYLGYQGRVYRDTIRGEGQRPAFDDLGAIWADAERISVLFVLSFGFPILAALDASNLHAATRLLVVPTDIPGWLATAEPSTLVVFGLGLGGAYLFPATVGGFVETDSLRGALEPYRLLSVLGTPVYFAYWLVAATVSAVGIVLLVWWAVLVATGVYLFFLPVTVWMVFSGFFIAAYVGTVTSYLAGHGYALARSKHPTLPPVTDEVG